MALYSPESFDSELIRAPEYDLPHAKSVMVRLRLQAAARILFGDQLFIGERWSLDSVSFLLLFSEISGAIEDLGAEVNLDRYSPFVAEVRSDRSHPATIVEHARRGDCQWSGFPILVANGREREKELLARFAEFKPASAGEYDRLGQILHDIGLPQHIANAVAKFARYIDDKNGRTARQLRSRGFAGGFYTQLKPAVERFKDRLAEAGEDENWRNIEAFDQACMRHEQQSPTSSTVAAISQDSLNDAMFGAIHHAARATYNLASSRGAKAVITTPAFDAARSRHIAMIDELLRPEGEADATLEFSGHVTLDAMFDAQLTAVTNWRSVWASVIRLSRLQEWQNGVNRLRDLTHQMPRGTCLLDSRTFRAMERMLAEHCPELVLEQTLPQRLRLTLHKPGTATAIEIASMVGAAAVSLVMVAPATAGFGAAGAVLVAGGGALGGKMSAQAIMRPRLTSSLLRTFAPPKQG